MLEDMVKVFALREILEGRRAAFSDAIQGALVEAFGLPPDKRAHRFFPLDPEDLVMPPDRSKSYTLIELSVIAGRSVEARKKLVRALFRRMEDELGIRPQDVEIVIYESAAENWGFRGLHGDEAQLSYKVKV